MPWAETLEKVIDEILALLVVVALIAAIFLGIEPGVLKDAFLLIIGFYFGSKGRKVIAALCKK